MAKFMKWIYATFLLSLLILMFISVNYYKRLERSNYFIDRISHSSTTILALEQANGYVQRTANTFRNYLITSDTAYLNTTYRLMPLLDHTMDSLYRLTADNGTQQKEVERVKSIIFMRKVVTDTIANRMSRTGNLDLNYFIQLEELKSTYELSYERIRENEYDLLKEQTENKIKFEANASATVLILIGFSALIVSIAFFYLVRALRKRIYFERELREKIDNLNMINRELENLSRATSHHIQEPLRKITNFASLMRTRGEHITESESNSILEKIENNAGSLQTMAHNLVQYANLIQTSKKKEMVDLNLLLKDLEQYLEDKIFEKKARILYVNLPLLCAIHSQIYLLFCELISNSLKFAKKGIPLEILITAVHGKDNIIVIEYADNGQGFSDEYAERIFRLFEQLDPAISAGKGVGLPMCARIMTNHGGSIRAKGRPGLGAVFTIEFPKQN